MSSTLLSSTSRACAASRSLSIHSLTPRPFCASRQSSRRLQSTSSPSPSPSPSSSSSSSPSSSPSIPPSPSPSPPPPTPNNGTHTAPQNTTPPPPTPIHNLTPQQQAFLSSALRVNQTGELAAILIYAAQTPILTRSHPHLRPLMKHMYDQEAGHFNYFNRVLSRHRVRPTAMYPIWTAAASLLGWGTAIMGREAAMACTEAVETEIGTHYNDQVGVLLDWARKCAERGETLGPELDDLVRQLRRIRDEELEHLDHAVENDAKNARPYELLTEVIRGGCRGAIWISERV